ncbi:hypothetical protein EZS27_035147 [termite gut metagenome]|uniref:DUF5618 domain-containing protein n=1 Tax=termite gut metagenome TaxID=433724 RepID=A0A5J4PZR1_9ZZZZ
MEDEYYISKKYVRRACETAYNGVLIALDTYLLLKGVGKAKGSKSIEYYQDQIEKIDMRLFREVDSAYGILYMLGYYDGTLSTEIIQEGFRVAYEIIIRIKPTIPN